MEVFLTEVSGKKQMKEFVLFPHDLYAGNSNWVPSIVSDELKTLDRNANPSFEYCEARYWLAYNGDKVVGRVAAIINNAYVQKWQKRYLRFGWLDFVDDISVSAALLGAVEAWASTRGMDAVHGPLGFTDFDAQGLLVEGFDHPGVMSTIYNYSYYEDHLEKLGYRKDADWLQYRITVPEELPINIERIAKNVGKRLEGTELVEATSSRALRPYAAGVFHLINETYKDLYGVVTLSEKQIKSYTNQYFSFIHPEYVSLVVQNKSVIGFAIAMPSLSGALRRSRGRLFPLGFVHFLKAFRTNETADLYLMAVHPDFQAKGATALLIKDMHTKFRKNKIAHAITHPMLEENTKILSIWNYFQKELHTRRRCYLKQL